MAARERLERLEIGARLQATVNGATNQALRWIRWRGKGVVTLRGCFENEVHVLGQQQPVDSKFVRHGPNPCQVVVSIAVALGDREPRVSVALAFGWRRNELQCRARHGNQLLGPASRGVTRIPASRCGNGYGDVRQTDPCDLVAVAV